MMLTSIFKINLSKIERKVCEHFKEKDLVIPRFRMGVPTGYLKQNKFHILIGFLDF